MGGLVYAAGPTFKHQLIPLIVKRHMQQPGRRLGEIDQLHELAEILSGRRQNASIPCAGDPA